MYFGGLRPAEAVALRRPDCTLPDTGWGSLILLKSRPTVGTRWTGTGEVHDNRGLKNRPANETRIVPIPPRLVCMLRVEVLLSRYAKCLDGRQDVASRRIAALLGEDDDHGDSHGDGT
ncbi:hypothetical protein GCM10010293_22500 [Streptomyces griseoflavus]|nr:hypothetical protein GCM10010293_22500 [Streptomyces griseoflavus]